MATMFVFSYNGRDGITKFKKVSAETSEAAHELANDTGIDMADVESCESFWAIYDEAFGIQSAVRDFSERVFKFNSRTDEP